MPSQLGKMDKQKIVNKHFQRAFLGYDVEEVDAFLDEIIRDMERADQELGIAKLRIRMLLEELENHGLIKCRRSADAANQQEPVCEPLDMSQPQAPEEASPQEAESPETSPGQSTPEETAPEAQAHIEESAAPAAQNEVSQGNESEHEQN